MEIAGADFGFPLVANLAILRHRSTYRIPWHRHDTMELQYVLGGAITYEFRHGRQRTITGSSLFVVPAGMDHRALGNEGAPSARIGIQFNLPTKARTMQTPFRLTELSDLFSRLREHACVPYRWTTEGGRAARRIFRMLEREPALTTSSAICLRHLVSTLLIETASSLDSPRALAGEDVMSQVMGWARSHCSEDLSIADLVRISGYSRTRLFTLFEAKSGLAPNDFILRCRVEKAKRMMREGRQPLVRVAPACGFQSSSYFSTVFRKYTGVSPSQWLARNSKRDV